MIFAGNHSLPPFHLASTRSPTLGSKGASGSASGAGGSAFSGSGSDVVSVWGSETGASGAGPVGAASDSDMSAFSLNERVLNKF